MTIPFFSRLRKERDEARRVARKLYHTMKERSDRTAEGNATRAARQRERVIAKTNEMRRAMGMAELSL